MNKTDTLTQLQEIKTETLEKIVYALEISYPKELNTENFHDRNTTWELLEFGYKNGDETELLKYVETITETNDVRPAYAKIYEELEARKIKSSKEAQRPESPNETSLNKDKSAQFQEEAQRMGEQIKQAEENAKKEVERVQAKLREIKERNDQILRELEKQKEKKLYVKINKPEEPIFTPEEQLDFDNYKENLRSIKKEEVVEAVDNLAEVIEQRIGKSLELQGLNKEEVEFITKSTAAEIIDNIIKSDQPNHVPETVGVAINNHLVTHPDEVSKITKNPKIQELIKENLKVNSPTDLLQTNIYREFTIAAFGNKFTDKVFGPDPSKLKVEAVSETYQPNYTTSSTPYVAYRFAQMSIENKDESLQKLKEFGVDHARSILINDAKRLLQYRLEWINPQTRLGKFTKTPQGDLILRHFGIGPQDGLSAVEKLGVDAGIAWTANAKIALWAKNTTQAAVSIANTGGIMQMEGFLGGATAPIAAKTATGVAVKTGLKGLFTKISGVIGGIFGGPVGTAILTAVTELLSRLLSALKRWWDKNKESIKPFLAVGLGLAAFRFLGPGWGLGIGIGSYILSRRIRAAAIGAGIWSFFTMLGGVFVATIATPVIVTLLILPPLVAFIMLVINNSAYMVPGYPGEYSKPPEPGIIPGGGQVSHCTESAETGPEITNELVSRIPNGFVNILPDTVWGRRDGICIKPTMIIMHWSAGPNDDPNGNDLTYNVLVERNLSCQLGTDTNDVWLMEKFFEKQVEFPACAKQWNTYSINNEMAGVSFTKNPPPPNLNELELAYNATCEIMKQYGIPWSQIYGHYQVPYSGKVDPGEEFLQNVFIPEIRKRCPNEQ